MVGETLDKRAAEAKRAQAHRQAEKFVSCLRYQPAGIPGRAAGRAKPDQQRQLLAVQSGCEGRLPCLAPLREDRSGQRQALLASDGFLALASDYGAYGADSLMQAAEGKGLARWAKNYARSKR